ncbi:alpha/beta hydrolase [Chloroflexi bacterium TSY]|nr:alpha/beta hydrolase [Chloroflexi bacterium TSY]
MILEGTRRKRTTGFIRANDGVRLYYEEMGQGRPILLIHGGGLSMAWWRKQIPVLATQFRVIAADTRGNGRSDKTAWGHRTARYAMDVREVIEALDLNGVTLVGWSIGARTVLSYLELFRGYRLNGAVLVDEVPCLALHEPVVHDDEAETEDGAAEDEMVRLRLGFRQMFATEISEEELDWMVDETKGNSPDQSVTLGPDYKKTGALCCQHRSADADRH